MVDTELLREKIRQSGYKMQYLASALSITYRSFLNKVCNRSDFKASEIQKLYKLLNLTEKERSRIFFASK